MWAGERLELGDSYLVAMAALLIVLGTEFYLRSKRALDDAPPRPSSDPADGPKAQEPESLYSTGGTP